MENEEKKQREATTIKCPYCCKEIPMGAKKCQHCGEWLIDKKELRKENNIFKVFSIICLILACIFVVMYATSIGTGPEAESMLMSIAILGCIAYYLYFLPTVIATKKKHPNTTAIFLVNLLFGFTCIGWIVALIFAVMEDKN